MRNKKPHSKNNRYAVPQLRVASINFFPKDEKVEPDDKPANESNSTEPRRDDKRSSNLPEFYQAKIKPKNFDPL